jgi:hypothetical protein
MKRPIVVIVVVVAVVRAACDDRLAPVDSAFRFR